MSAVLDDVALEGAPEVATLLGARVRPEPEAPIVFAFDLSSSKTSAALVDSRGNEIAGSRVLLSHGLSELTSDSDSAADALVDSVAQAIDVALARAESFVSQIDYVAAACFWHSLLGIDGEGRAVTPLFGWAETRAAKAVAELQSRFDETETHQRTGARFHPSYWPARLLWLKEERFELFSRVKHWLSFSDYLFSRFFYEATTSVSMASGTGL